MIKNYVLDSFAWIEYFIGSEFGSFIDFLLKSNKVSLFTPSIVIAELSFKFQNEKNNKWEYLKKFIKAKSTCYELNFELGDKSGTQKLELRKWKKNIGLADAIIYQTALELNAKLVSGDPHFENVQHVIFLKNSEHIKKEIVEINL